MPGRQEDINEASETVEFVEAYRSWGMYLDDLSCCGQECLTC
ncbi:MAG: hypothetical protein ACJZ5P_00155 [Candidatus Thalassarchaeaceae archaeon]